MNLFYRVVPFYRTNGFFRTVLSSRMTLACREMLSYRMVLTLLLGGVVSNAAQGKTLHVFAAASLTEAFTEIGASFESGHPGATLEFNFSGSQVLRTQIEQGADADVFASADHVHAEALQEKELLGETSIFARNLLVVVTPAEDARVENLMDLARPGTKVVVAGSTVPVGRYTSQALRKLSGSGLYGDDYQTRVQANVVSQESNVRAVLAKVALGEADAGFVYVTDATTAADKITVLKIPDRLNVIAEYPIGIVAGAQAPDLARQFVEFVSGRDGQTILGKYGFLQ
jgi:molybdate transport system substrate-binding protein